MKITFKCSLFIIPLIPLTFLVSGCRQEDLTAVEQFGLMSPLIRQSSSNIVQDIYDSCVRKQEWAVAEIPPKQFPPIEVRDSCQKFIPVRDTTNQLNLVLIDYVESLGRLAADNTVNFNQNLQSVGNSLGNLSNTLSQVSGTVSLSQDQIQQGTIIVNSLLKLWSQQFRRNNLKQVLICTDDPYFQNYTILLKEIIQNVYVTGNLQSEEDAINSYFDSAYREAVRSYKNEPSKLANEIASLTKNYTQQINNLDRRKEAAIAYEQLLEKTRKAHQALAIGFQGQMTTQEKIVFCQNYFPVTNTQSVQSQAKANRTLNQPNEQELKEMGKILKDYSQEIKPLVEKMNK